ncbi:MAG: hypothetical protein HY922_00440 [Elusimicrobia bacterium]|nr:hypothetical protein [Elusimicrobiota bacterium]
MADSSDPKKEDLDASNLPNDVGSIRPNLRRPEDLDDRGSFTRGVIRLNRFAFLQMVQFGAFHLAKSTLSMPGCFAAATALPLLVGLFCFRVLRFSLLSTLAAVLPLPLVRAILTLKEGVPIPIPLGELPPGEHQTVIVAGARFLGAEIFQVGLALGCAAAGWAAALLAASLRKPAGEIRAGPRDRA